MKLPYVALLAALTLAGCASRPDTAKDGAMSGNVGRAAASSAEQTREGLADAALSPLEDLNVKRDKIPKLLADLKTPYDVPADIQCDQIAAMLAELNAVLGPDWDTPAPDERLNSEKLADEAADAALNAVESGVTGWIPFRGVLREATGAAGHMRKYNQAFKIGAQRRTYLKGIGLAMACELPARPDFETMAADADKKIEYK